MVELTDEVLIKLTRLGDEVAFEHLLRRYRVLIERIIRNYFLPSYEPEDFYQIAAMAFHRAVLTYANQNGASFYSYALSCVRNKLVSLYRHELVKTEYVASIQEMTTVMEAQESYQVDKIKKLEADKELLLNKCRREIIRSIPKKRFSGTVEKQIVEALLDGLTCDEICDIYDFDRVKVSNAMSRLRLRLKKYGLID